MKAKNIGELVIGLLGILPMHSCTQPTYGNPLTTQETKKEIFLHPKEGSAVTTSDLLPGGLYHFQLSVPLDQIEEFGIDGKKQDNYGKLQRDNNTSMIWPFDKFPDGQHTAYVKIDGQIYTRGHTLDRTKPIIEYLESNQFLVSDHISGLSDVHLQRVFERSPPEKVTSGYSLKGIRTEEKIVLLEDHIIVAINEGTNLDNLVLRAVDRAGNASFARLSEYIR